MFSFQSYHQNLVDRWGEKLKLYISMYLELKLHIESHVI
jgi:hypothetical protein